MDNVAANPYESPQAELARGFAPPRRGLLWLFFAFEGRISRPLFWFGMLVPVLVIFSLEALMILLILQLRGPAYVDADGFFMITSIACIPLTWIHLAVMAKRWHDRDKSGWWSLVGLIPYVGPLWIWIELGFFPGTGTNRYGPDPQRSRPTNPS